LFLAAARGAGSVFRCRHESASMSRT
jgi:hypothetical protein